MFQQRVLWFSIDIPRLLVVAGDSPLNSIYDIKDKKGIKVISLISNADFADLPETLADFLEVPNDWITSVPFDAYSPSVRAIIDGKADVCIAGMTSAVTYEVAASPRGIKTLAIPHDNKAGWERLLEGHSMWAPTVVSYGVDEGIGKEGLSDIFFYHVLPDFDEETAYNLAKWFDENFPIYSKAATQCERMSIDIFRRNLDVCPFPVHEGTIRYLREKGMWTAEDDKWNAEAIELIDKYIAARNEFYSECKEKGFALPSDEAEDLWNDNYLAYLPRCKVRT